MLFRSTDFAISNIADSLPLKSIAISSEERLSFLSNTATGKEVGFDKFRYITLSTISIPKESKNQFVEIGNLLFEICLTEDMQNFFRKSKIGLVCYNTEQSFERIRSEVDFLKTNKHLIK